MTVVTPAANYLERNIKDLLTEHPSLGELLNSFNIGCVTCSVGTCQMKDIVQFHYLPEDQLRELMAGITAIVDPGGTPPAMPSAPKPAKREISYSPPMRTLVDEHALIKRFLALVPEIIAHVDLEREADRQMILDGVDFIRSYADRYHHAKEEDILFKHFDETQEIIRVMYEDHTAGRNHVKAVVQAVETRDQALLKGHLLGYQELLTQHIKKEDEILYPWMDRQMSMSQVGGLFREFDEADTRFAPGMAERYEQFIAGIEQILKG